MSAVSFPSQMSWTRHGCSHALSPLTLLCEECEEPSSVSELVTYFVALLSFSGSEGPENPAARPNTFVLSLPRCLKIPGCQEDHSLLLVALKVPGRRPSKGCWWLSHSAGEPGSTHSTGHKIQQLQAPSGNLGQKCDPHPLTGGKGHLRHHLLPLSIEWVTHVLLYGYWV